MFSILKKIIPFLFICFFSLAHSLNAEESMSSDFEEMELSMQLNPYTQSQKRGFGLFCDMIGDCYIVNNTNSEALDTDTLVIITEKNEEFVKSDEEVLAMAYCPQGMPAWFFGCTPDGGNEEDDEDKEEN